MRSPYRVSIAATIRPCSSRLCSCSSPLYLTSWAQHVLERVLEIGKQRGLEQELCRLQVRQERTELLPLLGNLMEQDEGHVLADDQTTWRSRLASGRSRSMRAARLTCTVVGIWMVPISWASR